MNHIPPENLPLVHEVLQDLPRPDRLAGQKLSSWLQQQRLQDDPLEIDVLTFHYRPIPAVEGGLPYHEVAVIAQKMNLVEALLSNWQGESAAGYDGFHYGDWAGIAPLGALTLAERLEPLSVLSNGAPYMVFNGLYRRSQPPRYAPDTRLPVRAENFHTYIWSLHFHHSFKASLDDYWAKRQALYQQALRIAFIGACNQQLLQGNLSEAARQLAWRAAGLLPLGSTRLSMLNVYGYTSTSILQICEGSVGRVLLYIPGNAAPLHEFDDAAGMKRWFAAQCVAPEKRSQLLGHFARADWPDGLDFSGLETALEGLGLYPQAHRFGSNHPGFATSGVWDPQVYIDYRPEKYGSLITGDLFEYLTLRQKQRAYADADSQITNNHDIDKARWKSYLGVVTVILAPIVVMFPHLSPLLVATGLAQFALGLDQAINGKDLAAKDQGVSDQAFGLLNAVMPLGSTLAAPGGIYRYVRSGFFTPARLTDVLQAPFGAAPVARAPELAEQVFHKSSVISTPTSAAVSTRVDVNLQHHFMARLQTAQGIVDEPVNYEFSTNSFIRSRDTGMISPLRWRADRQNREVLVPRITREVVSNSQRMTTLQALGIDVQLPIDYEPFGHLQTRTIPKVVSSIWLGDQPVSGQFLEALTHNAKVLRDSGYRFQIYLSREHHASYLLNLNTLRTQAEGALLMPLEDQDFYRIFEQSPYFAQYRAALSGGARNPASACDILRYRLLHRLGGLYLDADDKLLVAGRAGDAPPLARVELKTTSKGLLLAPPVSNEQLGMYIQYNNSMIGSHPGNPTLDFISQEILRRFSVVPDFYASRPDALLQPALFSRYGRRLSLLSGPAVLNALIDEHLPMLKQLRELCKMLASPIHDLHATLDLSRFSQVMREQVPLDQVARMGSAHSWAAI
ncbi:dermonecrotic toxin domain-containing protein [Pseudomonas sp. NPDC008258]|uniref:dermonecrotic toxin domain-containing protein n=1 Tax=Pseudomonas sp. NPDC008258 TaxID=3364418 RepID=UPI0036F14B67